MQFNNYEEQEEYYKKMEEYKQRREFREDAMTFLDFLNDKLSDVERLSHNKKSDLTYNNASNIMQRINSRFHREDDKRNLSGSPLLEKRHLELTSQILFSYKSNLSDKAKTEIISDFRKNLIQDLEGMIRSREIDTGSPSEC